MENTNPDYDIIHQVPVTEDEVLAIGIDWFSILEFGEGGGAVLLIVGWFRFLFPIRPDVKLLNI